MAEVAQATTTPAEIAPVAQELAPAETSESIKFGGTSRNLVPGMALLLAGILAFMMGMTDVFFAAAMAWVSIIWGALLIYAGLIDIYETFEVTEDSLIIRNVMRPWNSSKAWEWENISRMEILVRRKDWRPSNAKVQVYYTATGELGLEREDRSLDPQLAELIVERAGLKPASADNPKSVADLPLEEDAMYTWQ